MTRIRGYERGTWSVRGQGSGQGATQSAHCGRNTRGRPKVNCARRFLHPPRHAIRPRDSYLMGAQPGVAPPLATAGHNTGRQLWGTLTSPIKE